MFWALTTFKCRPHARYSPAPRAGSRVTRSRSFCEHSAWPSVRRSDFHTFRVVKAWDPFTFPSE